jgi:hypothetical protein
MLQSDSPCQPKPTVFYIQQPLKHSNLILCYHVSNTLNNCSNLWLIIQYFNMNRNKYKKFVLQNLSSERIILKFYYKIVKCFYWIKNSSFYENIITVFQFTQRSNENRSACRRLPTPVLDTGRWGITTCVVTHTSISISTNDIMLITTNESNS